MDVSVQKLNGILEEVNTMSTFEDEAKLDRSLERVKGIAISKFTNKSSHYNNISDLSGRLSISRSGWRESHRQTLIGIIQVMVDEIEIQLPIVVEIKKNSTNESPILMNDKTAEKNSIFIVHGHDEEAKIKTARFIEQLGFKPIILHEQVSSGKTIIEKIEKYSNVGFGIILYTPCDVGGKKKSRPKLKDRARQNVVFEHGYLIGRIGRSNVCALVKGDLETPNDISGVVYVKMDSEDAWHLKIAKELRNAGYLVDMNKI